MLVILEPRAEAGEGPIDVGAARSPKQGYPRQKSTGTVLAKVGTREGLEAMMAAIVPLTAAVDLAKQTMRCERV